MSGRRSLSLRNHPQDAQFGPDGSLYVLEYGSGWFGDADDNGLYRIDYLGDADPDPGGDPWGPVDEGYEIQIYDVEEDPLYTTGSVYTFAPAIEQAANPVGEWNTFEIEVRGQEYTVTLNGVEVATYIGDGSRGLAGHVGLQNHALEDSAPGDSVEFRDVWIRELDDGDVPEPDITVSVGPGGSWTYDPEEFQIYEGETIEYVLDSGFHNVVTVDSEGNEIATSRPPSSDWQDDPYYFTAEETGTFYIYCAPHAGITDPDPENWTGMVGKFEVLPSSDEPGTGDND